MAYTAGNLEVTISGIDDNASASINTVIRRLNSLQKSLTAITKLDVSTSMSKLSQAFSGISTALNGINSTKLSNIATIAKGVNSLSRALNSLNNVQTVLAGNKLDLIFNRIGSATNSINTTNINNLASAAKSLSSLTRLTKLNDLDWNKISKGFSNMTTAIAPFLTQIRQAEASLTSLYGILQKVSGKKLQGLSLGTGTGGSIGQAASNINFGAMVGKLTAAYAVMQRIGSAAAEILQYGVDYTETLNLWQVAMGENLAVAEEFVDKMNEAYGISTQTLMNAQAIFKNMLSGLGEISDSSAYLISEAITQMAVDYSSLYNITLEDAFTKFQAALAGQVRPIRSVSGYDITETTLEQVYQGLGGIKSIRNLFQTEKRLLSIYAIFQQMGSSGALGDMTKTLDNFANQSRMATESWKELATWAGIVMQEILQSSGVMTYLNAALMTAAEVVKQLAYSMGYVDPDFGISWADNMEGANEEVDELQGKLLGFDQFRSLSGSEESSLSIDETLLNALGGYDSNIENATNEARELSDAWLQALGFTKDANGEWETSEENLEKIKNTVLGIGTALGVVAALFAGGAILGGITKLTGGLGKLTTSAGGLNGILGAISSHPIIAVITAVVAVLALLYATNEDFRESVNELFEALGNAISAILTPLLDIATELFDEVITPLFESVGEFLGAILEPIIDALGQLMDGIIAPLLSTLGNAIATVLTPILNILMQVLTTILPPIMSLITELATNVLAPIITTLGNLLNTILKPIIEDILTPVLSFLTELLEGILPPIMALLEEFIGAIGPLIETIGGFISDFVDTLIDGPLGDIINMLNYVVEFISDIFAGNWEDAWKSLANIPIAIINFIISAFEAGINFFIDVINDITGGLSNVWTWLGIPAIPKIPTVTLGRIEYFAEGGLPDKGTMFVAGEAGAEVVYNNANGQSGVANINQLKAAFYQALVQWSTSNAGDSNINVTVQLDGETVYRNTTAQAKRRGQFWSTGR